MLLMMAITSDYTFYVVSPTIGAIFVAHNLLTTSHCRHQVGSTDPFRLQNGSFHEEDQGYGIRFDKENPPLMFVHKSRIYSHLKRARNLVALSTLAAGLFALTPAAHAQFIGMDFTSSTFNSFTAAATVGYSFTTSKTIDVTGLGIWDQNGTGLHASHTVGLWNSSGSLLTSALVDAGTFDTAIASDAGGDFRVKNVTPLLLTPGTYEIAAWYPGFDDFWALQATPQPLAGVTFGSPLSGLSGSLFRPTGNSLVQPNAYFGPTFVVASVGGTPEPGSLALIVAMSLTGAGILRRRRAR